MRVVKPGVAKTWSVKATCSGKGSGGGGCGAELVVEETDLFRTSRGYYDGSTDNFVTFSCPECGILNNISERPPINYGSLPTQTEYKALMVTKIPEPENVFVGQDMLYLGCEWRCFIDTSGTIIYETRKFTPVVNTQWSTNLAWAKAMPMEETAIQTILARQFVKLRLSSSLLFEALSKYQSENNIGNDLKADLYDRAEKAMDKYRSDGVR